jgi:hypothetical protein
MASCYRSGGMYKPKPKKKGLDTSFPYKNSEELYRFVLLLDDQPTKMSRGFYEMPVRFDLYKVVVFRPLGNAIKRPFLMSGFDAPLVGWPLTENQLILRPSPQSAQGYLPRLPLKGHQILQLASPLLD